MPRRRSDNEYYEDAHDERVEPYIEYESAMPKPDWGGVIIHPNQKKMPVGDPTLWANSITTQVDSDPILGSTPRAFYGEQIILAQAADRYSRSWSLTGSVELPAGWWANDIGVQPVVGPFAAGVTSALWLFLSVIVGIEKISIEQQICLAAGGWVSNIGLCNNQCTINGGPYFPVYADTPASPSSLVTCPFAAIGALVGNTVSARAFIVRGTGVEAVPQVKVSCLITPYAPGAGI